MTLPGPEILAQRQLDAYNAKDIETFVACYAEEVEVYDFPSQTPTMKGRATLRARYGTLFENEALQAALVSRVVIGDIAIDEESVSGLVPDALVRAVAMYEVTQGLIRRVWFLRE
jgi:hypothetical protein